MLSLYIDSKEILEAVCKSRIPALKRLRLGDNDFCGLSEMLGEIKNKENKNRNVKRRNGSG